MCAHGGDFESLVQLFSLTLCCKKKRERDIAGVPACHFVLRQPFYNFDIRNRPYFSLSGSANSHSHLFQQM